jgi:hypothetical protein
MARERESFPSVDHVVDGITYSIHPTHGPGGYHASWICQECGERGSSNLMTATKDDSVGRAIINLLTHHGMTHRKGKNAPDESSI